MSLNRRGGIPRYGWYLGHALAERTRVGALVCSEPIEEMEWEVTRNLDCYGLSTYEGVVGAVRSMVSWETRQHIVEFLGRAEPDVIYHANVHPLSPLVNWLAPDVPIVVTVHDPWLVSVKRNFRMAPLQWLAVRQATAVVVLSEAAKNELMKRGFGERDVHVSQLGPFFPKYGNRPVLGAGEGGDGGVNEGAVLFFGQVRPYKGLGVLLRAFESIEAEYPRARLLVVCSGSLRGYGSLLSRLRNVEVHRGWVRYEEIAMWLRRATCVVLPYVGASQSGVAPMAMAEGVPVVASDVGGLSEQVKDGSTGYVVPPGDEGALAEACLKVLKSPEEARRLGQEGRRYATTALNWRVLAGSLVRFLEDVAG